MVKILYPAMPTWLDYPDKENLAVCVCMMGCDNGCIGCQNPEFQNPQYLSFTRDYTVDSFIEYINELCERNQTNKVVLSGGDPLSCFNIDFTKEFLSKTDKDVCIYTGHDIDYVKEHQVKGFKYIKCGKYDHTNKQESYKTDYVMQFASPNQILYDDLCIELSVNGVYKFN